MDERSCSHYLSALAAASSIAVKVHKCNQITQARTSALDLAYVHVLALLRVEEPSRVYARGSCSSLTTVEVNGTLWTYAGFRLALNLPAELIVEACFDAAVSRYMMHVWPGSGILNAGAVSSLDQPISCCLRVLRLSSDCLVGS